jgi:ammonia channel protein AmtB
MSIFGTIILWFAWFAFNMSSSTVPRSHY